MKKSFQRLSVGAAVAAILSVGGVIPQAMAADDGDGLAEITVTGSRITRRDAESNSPLVTVDAADLESRSGLNVESYLNQLPNYNPAVTPTTGDGDVQISPINTVGIATVSLRGFGSNRSLVLADGHRVTPVNSLMQVDTNSIPSSMIKSVEIISGGASATYGADAIGGVTNFILNRDFEGMTADAQYGITEAGDGQEMRFSALVGSKLADGRGHVTFAAEYYDRQAAYDKNRSFFTKGWADPTIGGNFLGFVFGANGYYTGTGLATNNPVSYSQRILTNIVDAQGRDPNANTGVFGFGSNGLNASIRMMSGGRIFLPTGNNSSTFDLSLINGADYAWQNAYDGTKCNSSNLTLCPDGPTLIQQVKYNDTDGFTSAPQTRFAFMGTASYDITDKLHFQTSGRFAQSRTLTYLAGTNASNGWEVTIPYDAATDSPIRTDLLGDALTPAIIAEILQAPGGVVPAAYANTGFIPHGSLDASGAVRAHNPVTPAMAMLLNNRTRTQAQIDNGVSYDPLTAGWILETYPWNSFDRRRTDNVLSSWQVDASLNYELPVKDWTAELYYSRGETVTYETAYGNNSLSRWREVASSADYGFHGTFQNNLDGNNRGFGSVATPCTSGFYDTIFNSDATPSEDCLYAVAAVLQTSTLTQQDIMELNLQGGLFNTWAGEVRGAAGYQFRRNATQFTPDILQSTASSTDQAIGLYPTGYMNAQTVAKDIYAEALVPVLSDSFVNKVELELGGRYSEYSNTDSTTTWKALANIEVNDYVRMRGGFNRATRAPNLGEMFLPLQQIFTGGSAYGDPCSLRSNSPFGAGGAWSPSEYKFDDQDQNVAQADRNLFGGNIVPTLAPGQTPEGAQSARMICQAQMDLINPGAGGAADRYYHTTVQGVGGGGFAWVNQIGNPNLKSETADTWTAGVVFRSPFENAWLRNITATFDWYKIDISNIIVQYSITYAQYLCYGAVPVTTAAEALAQAQSQACQNTARNFDTGTILNAQVSFDNQAAASTSGIDFTLNWRAQLEDLGLASIPGGVSIGINGSWLDYYKTKTSPAAYDPVIDWKGSLGPQLTGFNGGAYSYRLFTNLGYNLNAFSVNLRWRHLPSVLTGGQATMRATMANNERVLAGGEGLLLSYSPSSAHSVKSYDAFDLSANWTINDMLSVRAGIDNVFDKQPAITGKSDGFPVGTDLAGLCTGQVQGCIAPTSYSLPSTGQGGTNAGFYDVLGRRYFIGLRATF